MLDKDRDNGFTPMGDLPDLGIDPEITRTFFSMEINLDRFDQLPPEIRTKLKHERYVPIPDSPLGADLDLIEGDAAYFGRIVVGGSAINDVYEKYGDEETLRANFLSDVGFVGDQEGEQIVRVFSEVTGRDITWNKYKERFVEGKEATLPVIDDLGPNNTLRAYLWPYLGERGKTPGYDHPLAGVEEKLKERFKQDGIKPWRVGTITMTPTGMRRNVTTCVFLGK